MIDPPFIPSLLFQIPIFVKEIRAGEVFSSGEAGRTLLLAFWEPAAMVTTRRQASLSKGNGHDDRPAARAKKSATRAKAREDHVEYEFFGPVVGPVCIVLGLPAVMYALCGFCGSHGCASLIPIRVPRFEIDFTFSWEGLFVYLAWLLGVVSPRTQILSPPSDPRRSES